MGECDIVDRLLDTNIDEMTGERKINWKWGTETKKGREEERKWQIWVYI
jgi:hypothetical protein